MTARGRRGGIPLACVVGLGVAMRETADRLEEAARTGGLEPEMFGMLVALASDALDVAGRMPTALEDRERIAAALAVVGVLPAGPGLPRSLALDVAARWRADRAVTA